MIKVQYADVSLYVNVLSGFVKIVLTQDGFCSAPLRIDADSNSQPLYWKVTNPTLSPSHLQGQLPWFGSII